ncbi:hypothetical protein K6L44_11780 [Gluconacetobacter entanii]|uniref:glycosyltransferase family 9 protein n=1 Tax=Gluconacetobacter entanii TaxID=108528 RepID=UPI001C936A22|nr:hypothetical protein [Gluconacetobacter entanii]MBY4640650.1 hypothetical protein [Gluconacetobacter entanii]MCW4578922.1 hypothetical protein [Gluconacetobacter entanii]MCW4582317.1 hypothetical protein [Gluconacetobacter entanii]MCW4585713.1 hypothetical protein [Gluconacetobacter entanii]
MSSRLIDIVPGLARSVGTSNIIDFLLPGTEVPVKNDGITGSMAIVIDKKDIQKSLSDIPENRKYILLRDVIDKIKDYRTLLRLSFKKIQDGGWFIVTVPHQFLSERKYQMPSRYDSGSLRFYTPALLLSEIEEALDPTEYRIRILKDDDENYNYKLDIKEKPTGNQRIIAVIQKIRRPDWSSQMDVGGSFIKPYDPSGRTPKNDPTGTVTEVIYPENISINNIIVLKLDHRGDYIIANSALKQLKAQFPDANITFVCGSWNCDVARKSNLFSEVIGFDFFSEDMSAVSASDNKKKYKIFHDLMAGREFDLAIDLRFFEDTRPLLKQVKATQKAGFDRWSQFPWLDIAFCLPSPTVDGQSTQGVWRAMDFQTANENRHSDIIIAEPQEMPDAIKEIAIWGPYRCLRPGSYTFSFEIDSKNSKKQSIFFDMVYDCGKKTLYKGHIEIGGEEYPSLDLDINEPIENMEIRFYRPDFRQNPFYFVSVRYLQKGYEIGNHEMEVMYLLIQLICLRLVLPYARETIVECQK